MARTDPVSGITNMLKRILAAVDRTSFAYSVMSHAVELATLSKSELTLLSVINQSPLLKDSIREEEEKLKAFHNELVLKNFPKDTVKVENSGGPGVVYSYGPNGEVKIQSRIENGNPADKICSYADQINADLVVVGNRGLGNIGGLVLDSVSEKIVRKCSRTVMVVKSVDSNNSDLEHSHKNRHQSRA